MSKPKEHQTFCVCVKCYQRKYSDIPIVPGVRVSAQCYACYRVKKCYVLDIRTMAHRLGLKVAQILPKLATSNSRIGVVTVGPHPKGRIISKLEMKKSKRPPQPKDKMVSDCIQSGCGQGRIWRRWYWPPSLESDSPLRKSFGPGYLPQNRWECYYECDQCKTIFGKDRQGNFVAL